MTTSSNSLLLIGLGSTACVILMYEILLTRIFSVMMWYHFAFLAISIAMFGMTIGTMLVYIFPKYYSQERAKKLLAPHSLAMSATIFLAAVAFALVPKLLSGLPDEKAWTVFLAISYPLLAIPFVPGGIVVSLALTRVNGSIGRLYAADLTGAAFGCLAIIGLLSITDGMSTVIALASLAALSALFFARNAGQRVISHCSLGAFLVFASLAIVHTYLAADNTPLVSISLVKGEREGKPIFERWNSFSRVIVFDSKTGKPQGWGMSPKMPPDTQATQRWLIIDGGAGTVLTKFDGNLEKVAYLTYDITNLVHHIRHDADVLVIGIGGGRDILSALYFDQHRVTGMEINNNIISAVTRVFGKFVGHLDQIQKVKIVNAEARSTLASSKTKYDIIQVSLIDTFAATQAGALALTENSLYTVESWRLFLQHLKPNGIISFSRWHPVETYRITTLANEALLKEGVAEPRKHIILAALLKTEYPNRGVSTLLVSNSPFSSADEEKIKSACVELGFEVILSPSICADPTLAELVSGKSARKVVARMDTDISAPTDDRPFFFQTTRLKDAVNIVFTPSKWMEGCMSFHVKGLVLLMVIAAVLNAFFIFLPLAFVRKIPSLKSSGPLFLHFLCIGIGFMLLEIAQIQRLSIFLGAPVLGLSVVLFSLLLSGGIGSYICGLGEPLKRAEGRLIVLLCVIAVTGIVTPFLLGACSAFQLTGRILVAIALVSPMGLVLGMAFPLGIQLADKKQLQDVLPWFWGINGAASVFSSVLATFIMLYYGISATFYSGLACYILAVLGFIWAMGRKN
ncbi:MAG: hypothetical protein K2X93_07720 [Candidatus Obscuribacterales bacterium]|nr:hypothetical protein [Candidatus Obscuribacterales bacterium]